MAFGPPIPLVNIELVDSNSTLGYINFNQPDEGGLVVMYVTSGINIGSTYRLEWMQHVTPGDSVKVLIFNQAASDNMTEDGHTFYDFVATDGAFGINFRGYGTNGTGWLGCFLLREIIA